MPTARARHMITETDEIAAALDAAALRWPDLADERAELLRKLIHSGLTDLNAQEERRIALKREAIRAAAGSMTGLWPEGWLEELRSEWPE
jgi:hypothetical protein